jgi:hypothetical protein
MKKGVTIAASVVVLAASGMACAWEFGDVGIDVGTTYVSRYIWRGFDSYGNNHSAIQPYVDFTFGDSGFRAQVWWSRANGSGFENYEEFDYTLAYGDTMNEGESTQTDWEVGWTYFNYPDGPVRHSPTADLDYQEIVLSLVWPNICSSGVVPSYTLARMWCSESGRRTDNGYAWSSLRQSGGWMHIFGLAYDQTIPDCLTGNPERTLHWTVETIFNASAGGGRDVDHDWSHALFGVSTPFNICGGVISAFAQYQSSWDDSVNTSDEYIFGLDGTWKAR